MLEQVLTLLGISDPTTEVTSLLETIISMTQQRLMLRLGTSAVPTELEYIVVEVSIVRYNRIGSERLSSHNVEGESMAWSEEDDFKPYLSEINGWLAQQEEPPKYVGRLMFK
jgi:hypothetical protein